MSSEGGASPSPAQASRPARLLLDLPGRASRVTHVETLPERPPRTCAWPVWADPELVAAWRRAGVSRPWQHQADAAESAWAGRSVVLATGTASGKSLAYLLPVLTTLRSGTRAGGAARGPGRDLGGRGATALYLAPTKALAADQLAALAGLGELGVRAATCDGDTPEDARRWARRYANLLLTNPDMLHHSLLPGHSRWSAFLRGLSYVVVDECHHYRGVFGSHVSAVLRRLRRIAAHYGADPVFVLASATTADPAATARDLVGVDVAQVTDDASPRGRTSVLLWEPPLMPGEAGREAPRRRSALAETAEILADLVTRGVRSLAFVPSRRGAEAVAASARRLLAESHPELVDRVEPYRAGYLPEDRRVLEAALRSGDLLGVASTNALELGIDVSGLDAVVICGWPGRRSSLWQQAGRAGRRAGDAAAVLVARDDPLDTYVVHHPEAVFGSPVEATVLDPTNPYVLAPHLCAAAAELPLRPEDLALFGPSAADLVQTLVARGALRARPGGWYWTHPSRAGDLADLRGTGGEPVRVAEATTGRLLGTVDAGAAHHTVHEGAVHLHQGRAYLVRELDLTGRLALVEPTSDTVATQARDVVDIRIRDVRRLTGWGEAALSLGTVDVTTQVVSYLRRDVVTGAVLGEEPLDLPPAGLRTTAVWWTVPEPALAAHGVGGERIPGAAHAAEHAAIGLLPLVATCDRWDIGGVSTANHPDTGLPTVFVHDGHPGGAGFAERGFRAAETWLRATREVIAGCGCDAGCPSCIQSPKCGNGNEPLDKRAAVGFLDAVLDGAPGRRA